MSSCILIKFAFLSLVTTREEIVLLIRPMSASHVQLHFAKLSLGIRFLTAVTDLKLLRIAECGPAEVFANKIQKY